MERYFVGYRDTEDVLINGEINFVAQEQEVRIIYRTFNITNYTASTTN